MTAIEKGIHLLLAVLVHMFVIVYTCRDVTLDAVVAKRQQNSSANQSGITSYFVRDTPYVCVVPFIFLNVFL